jgi:hypothetical protein
MRDPIDRAIQQAFSKLSSKAKIRSLVCISKTAADFIPNIIAYIATQTIPKYRIFILSLALCLSPEISDQLGF